MHITIFKKIKDIKKDHPLFIAALVLWTAITGAVILLYGQDLGTTAGSGVFTVIILYMSYYLLKNYTPAFIKIYKNLILTASITALSILIVMLIRYVPGIPASSAYLFPAAAAGILLTVLIPTPIVAAAAVILISLIAAVLGGYSLNYFFVYMAGGLAAVFSARDIRTRKDLNRCGFYVLVFNFFAILAVELMSPSGGSASLEIMGINLAWGGLNALVSVVIAGGLLPIFESAFSITTNIKLLELGDFNTPLLKRLMLEAPGTYHHSLMVANLAENACEEIGANPLVARVGSYYHDIGKLSNPQYFSENQQGIDYKHDKLKPNISALILKRHVKDGFSLADEYNLDKIIKDMIEQHHGTSLIRFFYDKELNGSDGRDKVEKKEFKYPGPRPQTREAGVIMLADSVEAACRSLDEPTYSRITGLVEKIINIKFTEGQLNECALTMAGLEKIQKNFINALSAMYHSRIEYPEDKEEKAVE